MTNTDYTYPTLCIQVLQKLLQKKFVEGHMQITQYRLRMIFPMKWISSQ